MRLSAAGLVILGGLQTRHVKLTESDGDVSRILVSSSEIRRLGSCHPPILPFLSPALSRAPGLANLNLGPALVNPLQWQTWNMSLFVYPGVPEPLPCLTLSREIGSIIGNWEQDGMDHFNSSRADYCSLPRDR
jgi:hypothetical protein